MTGGQWEVVGGKTKKAPNKIKNHANNKVPNKKSTSENANVEASGPITESRTMFEAFLEKEKNESLRQKPKPTNIDNVAKPKESPLQKKKKVDKKANANSIAPTLESCISAITDDDIKNLFASVETRFPDSPNIWLKDLASYLNVKLDISLEDPTFVSKPIGYPCSLLKKGVYGLIVKMLNRCTQQTLQLYFEFCLQSLIQDTAKGIHTSGYRLVLQCLAQEMPSVITANLAKCLELCNANQSRQNVSISILWAAGQAGNKHFEAGFQVWIELMFPVIGNKPCANYTVDYLDRLLSSKESMKINKSIIGVRDLFPVLDFIYSKDSAGNIKKRLTDLYPKFKVLSYGPEPDSVLRNYFPSYLRRLEPQSTPALKEEVLKSLVYCLEVDSQSYSIWRQLYTKHLIQSKLLIAYLNEEWERLPPKFPKRYLQDTLSTFQVTNEELLVKGKLKSDVEECILISNELLAKINSQAFSWLKMMLIFVLVFSAVFSFDIISHGSFKDSTTGKVLKESGALAICTQAGEKIAIFYNKSYRFLETNIPIYTAWAQKRFVPYFELFWKKLINGCMYIWSATFNIRIWCNENIPPFLQMLDKTIPVYATQIGNIAKVSASFILNQLANTLEFLVYYGQIIIAWLHSTIFTEKVLENIQKQSSALLELLLQYTSSLQKYVSSLIS